MAEFWLDRWEQGRIGWHEPEGNASLKKHWPDLPVDSRVLVPFCGKAHDLYWLAQGGLDVVGVELSPIAVQAFFAEHRLDYHVTKSGALDCYRLKNGTITIYCGDYFRLKLKKFDALFDRAALVAVPADERPRYVEHTKSLLKEDSYRLIVTLEYDQSVVDGPPFAVMPEEIVSYWSDLSILGQHNDIDNCPAKFKEAGLTQVIETAWSSRL